MIQLIAFFLFTLCISFQTKADVIVVDGSKIENPLVKNMSAKDQWVYLFLRDICRNGSFPSFRDSISQSFQAGANLWSFDPARLQGYYKRGMTSTHIEAIFSSAATTIALEECYSHMSPEMKSERKERLMFELMFWDYVGNHFGLIAGTVGISRLFSAIFSTLNKFAWQPFKNYAQAKWKLNTRQLKWLDRFLIGGAIVAPVGIHLKANYEEQKQAEEYEISSAKRKLEMAKEVNGLLAKMDDQILKSNEKEFWITAKSTMQEQLKRLCREINENSLISLSAEDKAICQN